MTTVPVTDIANEFAITTFSEDGYPSNKNYEITHGQLSILRSVNQQLLSRAARTHSPSDGEDALAGELSALSGSASGASSDVETCSAVVDALPQVDVVVSNVETVIEQRRESRRCEPSLPTQTPSLSVVYDKEKRIQLLEEEVAALRQKRGAGRSSDNLVNFTNILFNKNPLRGASVNKRVVIVNYASMNHVPLTVEDLEDCSDDEIDNMYRTIKQYHEVRKQKIIVTNFIIILVNVLEQALLKVGIEDIKGLGAEVTSELIDVEIGDDCEQIAHRLGISNNPVLNITLFIVKLFIKRIKIL
uniref:Uncharacterized protein n=1 Tax=Rousettus bat poxvirus TaxID=3141933 RepID=A0AAU7E2Q2_9POXV